LLPLYSELDKEKLQQVRDFRRVHGVYPVDPLPWQQMSPADYEHVFVTVPGIANYFAQDPYNDDCRGGIGIGVVEGIAFLAVLVGLVQSPVTTIQVVAAIAGVVLAVFVAVKLSGRSSGKQLFI